MNKKPLKTGIGWVFGRAFRTCVIHFIPKKNVPKGEAKQPETAADVKTPEPVEWDRVIREKPGRESLDSLRWSCGISRGFSLTTTR